MDIKGFYSQEYIKEIFYSKIISKTTKGIDKLTGKEFEKFIDEFALKSSKRIQKKGYRFTPYLEKINS